MTIEEFTDEVNKLAEKELKKQQESDPKPLFGAVHVPFTKSMMRLYYEDGVTPLAALKDIDERAEGENETLRRAAAYES